MLCTSQLSMLYVGTRDCDRMSLQSAGVLFLCTRWGRPAMKAAPDVFSSQQRQLSRGGRFLRHQLSNSSRHFSLCHVDADAHFRIRWPCAPLGQRTSTCCRQGVKTERGSGSDNMPSMFSQNEAAVTSARPPARKIPAASAFEFLATLFSLSRGC